MSKLDLYEVARVHCDAFQGFFLTQMGEPFLRRYYGAVLDYSDSISLVALDEDGRIVGLASGFKNSAGFYRHFRRYRLQLLPSIGMALLRRPSLLFEIARNSSRVSRVGGAETVRSVELASICNILRGNQVGSRLLKAFIANAKNKECDQVTLSTDESNNEVVRAFYQKHGFFESGHEHRNNRSLVIYAFKLLSDVESESQTASTSRNLTAICPKCQ